MRRVFLSLPLLYLLHPLTALADCTQSNIIQQQICNHDPSYSQHQTQLFGTGSFVTTAANILIFLVGAISVIMLIVGGLRYVLSGGNPGSISSAKDTILYALIGVVVAILGYAAVSWVTGQFG